MGRTMMNCQPCGKRLSRKTARMINGVIMCSTCMFKPGQGMRAAPKDAPDIRDTKQEGGEHG